MKKFIVLTAVVALALTFGWAGTAKAEDTVRVSQEQTAGAGDFQVLGTVGIFTDAAKSAAQVYRYRRQSSFNPIWYNPRVLCPVSYTGFLNIPVADLVSDTQLGTVIRESEIAGVVSPVDAKSDTTQMWVMDTTDGRGLFVVHDIIDDSPITDFTANGCPPAAGIIEETTGGRQHMRFDLVTPGGLGALLYLVQDDQEIDFSGFQDALGNALENQEASYTDEGDLTFPNNLPNTIEPALSTHFDDTLVAQHNWEPSRTDGVVLGLPGGCDWTLFIRYKARSGGSTGISSANLVDASGELPVNPSTNSGENDGFGRTIKLECVAGPDVVTSEIDIKPGSYPNSINACQNGLVSVAILGTETFDPETEIAAQTCELNGEALAMRGRSRQLWAIEDVDDDGDNDLVLKFEVENLELQTGEDELTVTCELTAGGTFEGTDSIRVLGDSDECPGSN
jgi:hypothetical protein